MRIAIADIVMTLEANPYHTEIQLCMPRLLSLYDTDPFRSTRGSGDRLRWGWKTSDFSNATFQTSIGGLSRLIGSAQIPSEINPALLVDRIAAAILAIPQIMGRDGSLQEAYPNESSYCVTALVLFDLCLAIETLGTRFSTKQLGRFLAVAERLAEFLRNNEETHGEITNHRATAAAALFRWNAICGDSPSHHAEALLSSILTTQDKEGWFPEYGGADPGYQSLCLYYLADIWQQTKEPKLYRALQAAVEFINWFAHPDGSFGGTYGWRATRFLCPAGIEMLSSESDSAAALALFCRHGVVNRSFPVLSAFDEPNFPVMFNIYCAASTYFNANLQSSQSLPANEYGEKEKHFINAGIVVRAKENSYTIVSYKRGGVVYHFEDKKLTTVSGGVTALDSEGRVYSSQTQQLDTGLDYGETSLEFSVKLSALKNNLPPVWQYLALRILSLTVFKIKFLNEFFKKIAVKRFIAQENTGIPGRRRIEFVPELSIADELEVPHPSLVLSREHQDHITLHMASQGYWQLNNER